MSNKIYDLIYKWEISYKKGQELSIDELTKECPEIREKFTEELKEYREELSLSATLFKEFKPLVCVQSDSFKKPEKPHDLGLPDVICNRYEVMEYISSGSYGSVWKAWDTVLKRSVAVKIPSFNIRDNKIKINEFIREAEIMAGFQHENVVRIYDTGVTTYLNSGNSIECPYIIMELMDSSLKQHVTDWVTKPLEAATVILSLSDVLVSAHDYQSAFIHRDIKPNNILLKADSTGKLNVKLSDFGMSVNRNLYYKDEDLKLIGALGFIPPERIRKEPEDVRGDIFSLGVVLYVLITADLSFISTNTHTISTRNSLRINREVEYTPPETLNPLLSDFPEIVKICKKAMRSNPDERYNNAKEFSQALRKAINTYKAPSPHLSPKPSPRTFRRKLSLILITISLLGILLLYYTIYLKNENIHEDVKPNTLSHSKIILENSEPPANDLVILGKNYYRGDGVKQDRAKALDYFLQAAKKGNIDAQQWAGFIYLSSPYKEINDLNKAEMFLKNPADQGRVDAMRYLAIVYEQKGQYNDALKYYTAAAERGDDSSTITIPRLYTDARLGIKPDFDKYVKWLERAANCDGINSDLAKTKMAQLCETGIATYVNKHSRLKEFEKKYPVDKAKAIEWYRRVEHPEIYPDGELFPSPSRKIKALEKELNIDNK